MLRRVLTTVAVALGGLAAMAPAGGAAEFGFQPGSLHAEMTGPTATQAGAPADLEFGFKVNAAGTSDPHELAGTIKDLYIDLPKGIVANPTPFSTCSVPGVNSFFPTCAPTSAVGMVTVALANPGTGATDRPTLTQPNRLFRVPTQGDEAAAFAFNASGLFIVRMGATADPERGYRIRTTALRVLETSPMYETQVTLWGVPAEHQGPGPYGFGPWAWGGPLPADQPRPRFLTVPTRCEGDPLQMDFAASPWSTLYQPFSESIGLPLPSGCDQLRFEPSIAVETTSRHAGRPAGYDVDLEVPQNADQINGLETPTLKEAVVTLPEGVAISPAQANGLDACSDAQIDLHRNSAPACPAASKIGDVEIVSPLLDDPVSGNVFVGTQQSGDSESGDMYRVFIAARAPGVRLKLLGHVKADKQTGQLTARFAENPELPFSKFSLRFKGGETAVLANPATCGTHTTTTALTPWGGPAAAPLSSFVVDDDCGPQGFSPSFAAGSRTPVAGVTSPFSLSIGRPDRTAELSTLDALKLPKGLLGHVSKVALCSDADADAGTCGDGSRVGRVEVSAGAGGSPIWVPQQGKAPTSVSLAGPYKGAPYSLSVVVPAQAGPFDLGRVVARSPLHIDRDTAQLSTAIDVSRVFDRDGKLKQTIAGGMPTIVEGIPLRMRDLRVIVDKEGFMVNPTSCAPSSVDATLKSVTGQSVAVSSRFQVGNCAALEFEPQLAMSVGTKKAAKASGKRKTATAATAAAASTPSEMVDGGHPALSARLTMDPGNANNKSATVTLPKALALDPDNANGLCEPSAAATNSCPAASIVGAVSAVSPLVSGTVGGPVYFVRGERRDPKSGRIIKTLPRLFVPLTSSENPLLKIELHASSNVKDNRLVTTFDNLPDVPISSFELKINGGKHGILVVSNTNVCAATQYTDMAFVAQSNRRYLSKSGLDTACPLAVVKSSHSATALNLTVGGLAPGKVTITGKGLTKRTKTIPLARPQLDGEGRSSTTVTVSATTHTRVAVPMSRSMRRSLSRGRNVKVKVTVGFKAAGAKSTSKVTKTLVIHGKKK